MQLDLAGLFGAPETHSPAAPEKRGDQAPVADAFAALLAALAPTPSSVPSDPADRPEPEIEGDGGTAPNQAQTPGTACNGKAGSSTAAVDANAALPGADLAAPLVLGGTARPAPPLEVASEPAGLPLLPGTEGDSAAAGKPETPLVRLALARAASQGPSVATGATDSDASRPTVVGAARVAVTDETLTTVATRGHGAVAGDGRPVVTLELAAAEPLRGATGVPPVPPRPEGGPETSDTPEVAAAAGEEADLAAGGSPKAPAPTVDAHAAVVTPGPRPTAGGPEAGTTPGMPPATAPAGPEAAHAAPPNRADDPAGAMPRPADPQQIQAQVLRRILGRAEATDSRPRQITLQLEPEHLGKVEVKLTAHGDQLQVEIQAETAEAGAALREGRHELVRNLSAQAGRWQQIDVRVAERAAPAPEAKEHEEERSEHGSRRERDPHQRRRQRDER